VNAGQARGLVALLQAAWPGRDLPDESVSLYAARLEPLEFARAHDAVLSLIDGAGQFIPPVGTVVTRYYEDSPEFPLPEESWPLAVSFAVDGADAPDAIQRAVMAMGRDTIRMSYVDDPRPRENFIRIYRAIRDRAIRDGRDSVSYALPPGARRDELEGMVKQITGGEL
jgi:hypothetical protein